MSEPGPGARLTAEHRALDELFGRFLSAAWSNDRAAAHVAISEFDARLRSHMDAEESSVLRRPPGGKLVPREPEDAAGRLARELLLEHVQVRELSGMLVRRLSENAPLEEARALASNLARRWDSHTQKEEAQLLNEL